MRILLTGVVLVVLAGLAWAVLSDEPLPPPSLAQGTAEPQREDEADAAQSTARSALAERPAAVPAAPRPEEPIPPEPAAQAAGRLVVEVIDRAARVGVEAFRYVLEGADGRRAAPVRGAALDLELPLGTWSYVIEAEGYEPSASVEVSLTQAEPVVTRRVELELAQQFGGVELHVVDPASAPVPHVEVEALEDANGVMRSLWRRRTSDPRGIYQLPDLRPADYRLRVRAVDAKGEWLAFCVHDEDVTFAGSGRVVRSIQLRQCGQIDLTVVDGRTQAPLGTEVLVRVVRADGSALPVQWVCTDPRTGTLQTRVDGLPGAGPVHLLEPLPPGWYTLHVRRGVAAPAERAVQVFGDGRTPLRVVLP